MVGVERRERRGEPVETSEAIVVVACSRRFEWQKFVDDAVYYDRGKVCVE
jgi:hypothetical protein